jgi:hypothetical protein
VINQYISRQIDKGKLNDFIVFVMENEREWLFENPEVLNHKFIGDQFVYHDVLDCSNNASSDIQEIFDLYQSSSKYSRGGLQSVTINTEIHNQIIKVCDSNEFTSQELIEQIK